MLYWFGLISTKTFSSNYYQTILPGSDSYCTQQLLYSFCRQDFWQWGICDESDFIAKCYRRRNEDIWWRKFTSPKNTFCDLGVVDWRSMLEKTFKSGLGVVDWRFTFGTHLYQGGLWDSVLISSETVVRFTMNMIILTVNHCLIVDFSILGLVSQVFPLE